MTVFFEMHVRVGTDPRGFAEFVALNEELARLSHPACPDVDWARVEQWCQGLFEHNGADLHTAAAFALARSQRRGLEGMAQGVALIDALCGQWTSLWPAMSSVRLDILAWLFMQWQSLLRSMALNAQQVPALVQLDCAMLRLQRRLDDQVQIPLAPLQVLRQQLQSLILRLQHTTTALEPLQLSNRVPVSPLAMPMIIWPASPLPEVQPSKPRTATWACAAAATIMLAGGAWWGASGANIEGMQGFAGVFQHAQPVPAPVRLDSLLLFGPGSAELRPDSTKVLINALIDIKARPGWLIVISAHTDNSGDAERNLQLSHARASAVRDWMQRMGDIPPGCFAVQGFGANKPVANNDSEAGRIENRRVDIRLVPETNACPVSALAPVA